MIFKVLAVVEKIMEQDAKHKIGRLEIYPSLKIVQSIMRQDLTKELVLSQEESQAIKLGTELLIKEVPFATERQDRVLETCIAELNGLLGKG